MAGARWRVAEFDVVGAAGLAVDRPDAGAGRCRRRSGAAARRGDDPDIERLFDARSSEAGAPASAPAATAPAPLATAPNDAEIAAQKIKELQT